MNCNDLQKWIAGQNSEKKLNKLPDDFSIHLDQCDSCKTAILEARNYFTLMQNANTPELEDAFWENYLSSVSSKVSQETRVGKLPVHPIWLRKLVIPVAAVVVLISGVLLTDWYYPVLDNVLSDDDAYTSSLDFIWGEHEDALSQHMFDPTTLYAVEEVIPENWEEIDPQDQVIK
jgi:hypothetical protein